MASQVVAQPAPAAKRPLDPDREFLLMFGGQTKAKRVTAPPALRDRICNPYLKMPLRLDLVCTVTILEGPTGDPVLYAINKQAADSIWQLVDAVDMRALSEREARDAFGRILESQKASSERYVSQRVQLEVARQSAPVAMPYMGEPAALPSPSREPVRTRCDRVPYSITGTVNCVTE